jgi:hypothetical protein
MGQDNVLILKSNFVGNGQEGYVATKQHGNSTSETENSALQLAGQLQWGGKFLLHSSQGLQQNSFLSKW